jgi:hypothetical protein
MRPVWQWRYYQIGNKTLPKAGRRRDHGARLVVFVGGSDPIRSGHLSAFAAPSAMCELLRSFGYCDTWGGFIRKYFKMSLPSVGANS